MILAIVGVLVGGFFIVSPAWQLLRTWLARRRYVRVPGVIVGRRDARGEVGTNPATHSRAAIFRFTTVDGRVIETESDVQSFPGPRPGKRVTVIYDPRNPYDAETTGRFAISMLVMPVVMAVGVIVVVLSLAQLV